MSKDYPINSDEINEYNQQLIDAINIIKRAEPANSERRIGTVLLVYIKRLVQKK